ncbi:MAG: type II toxin-antitoxin system HicA family toxin [Candidatus Acidiferrales bacterium]
MKAISGKELCRVVEQHGWIQQRIRGSHHIYSKTGSIVRLSIPVHASKPLKIGLQKHLMKLAGLAEADLT